MQFLEYDLNWGKGDSLCHRVCVRDALVEVERDQIHAMVY